MTNATLPNRSWGNGLPGRVRTSIPRELSPLSQAGANFKFRLARDGTFPDRFRLESRRARSRTRPLLCGGERRSTPTELGGRPGGRL
jgi:hypothetical protein